MELNKYVLACDLKDDPQLIAEYEAHHQKVWPEIIKSIKESGIVNMEIYRTGTRLVMLMETEPNFSFDIKSSLDAQNPKVQEWESLMWNYQMAIPGAKSGEKWASMDRIFVL